MNEMITTVKLIKTAKLDHSLSASMVLSNHSKHNTSFTVTQSHILNNYKCKTRVAFLDIFFMGIILEVISGLSESMYKYKSVH